MTPGVTSARYREEKFVQLDDFVSSEQLTAIVERVLPLVRRYSVRVVRPHRISEGSLEGGRRFDRIDWGPFDDNQHTEADKSALRTAFSEAGLESFASQLLEEAMPFFEAVAERRLSYDRVFLLGYKEGDFIAPHGDTQTSRRVLVQMPVVFGTRTAFRMLTGGWMEPFYDEPGTLRLMGPGIWHDVLPVLRWRPDVTPERIVVTLRLPYADDD